MLYSQESEDFYYAHAERSVLLFHVLFRDFINALLSHDEAAIALILTMHFPEFHVGLYGVFTMRFPNIMVAVSFSKFGCDPLQGADNTKCVFCVEFGQISCSSGREKSR